MSRLLPSLILLACGARDPRTAPAEEPAPVEPAASVAPELAATEADRAPEAAAPELGEPEPGTGELAHAAPPAPGESEDLPLTRYPAATRSPITPSVAAAIRAIRARSPSANEAAFLKAGASGTVSRANMACFGPTRASPIDLDGREHLRATVERFASPVVGAQGAWDRSTLAAQVGKTARWVQTGAPSPLEQELTALDPAYAVVNFGTNDMLELPTFAASLEPFVAELRRLVDGLAERGVVPIVVGLNPRTDTPGAVRWVPTYAAVTRAIAESRQLPHVDLYLAMRDLDGQGLIEDGVHGTVYTVRGKSQACVLTAAGLGHNFNRRNLLTLETLHAVTAVTDGEPAPDAPGPGWEGEGSPGDPVRVDALPFAHHVLPGDAVDQAGCGELVGARYALDLPATTGVRWIALPEAGSEARLWWVDEQGGCVGAGSRMLAGRRGPGTVQVAVGAEAPGAFTLVAVACEPGDTACK